MEIPFVTCMICVVKFTKLNGIFFRQLPVVVTKALQTDSFVEIRDRFIKVIVDESSEEIVGTGLLKMFKFASSTVRIAMLQTSFD